jgi:FKBP-type peptidyl-prolyl cis-trans isomerase SlyD
VEKVEEDKVVTLGYRMKTHLADGTIEDHPQKQMTFIFGVERQVPSLERALEGCSVGDKMSLTIPASEIYGDHDPTLVKEIPKKGLIKQRLKEGKFYRQMKMGSLISFKVLEIRPRTVLADFNKPLAGISVSVDLEVVAIRKARKREIEAAMEAQTKRSIGCG